MLHLVRGRPGSGKTTLVLRICEEFADRGIRIAGFVTEEIRRDGKRWGFRVRDLRGGEAVMARRDSESPLRVGRYGVDLRAFEEVALPAISEDRDADLLVIDEIGRMELLSRVFREALEKRLSRDVSLLATIPACRLSFVDSLLSREDVRVYTLSVSNREIVRGVIKEAILSELQRSDDILGP